MATRKGRKRHTKNLLFKVSLRCLSTALWVALRSAVFALRLALRFAGGLPLPLLSLLELPLAELLFTVVELLLMLERLFGGEVGDGIGETGVSGEGEGLFTDTEIVIIAGYASNLKRMPG